MPITAGRCSKKYTLKLGNLYLAPRPSIAIEEPKNLNATLISQDSCLACGGNDIIDYWDAIFKIYYIGNGDLDTAWHMFDVTNATLQAGCDSSTDLLLTRSIRCETPRQWAVDRGFQVEVDLQDQYICKAIVAAELHLRLRLYKVPPPPYLYYFQGTDIS